MRIQIGNKTFEVKVSESFEESKIGLSKTEKLAKGEGFAMKFDGMQSIPITMQEMSFPLDVIFCLNGKVLKVVTAQPQQKDININKASDLVVEVNAGEAADIMAGDEVKFLGKKNEDGTVEMAEGGISPEGERHVLDEDGKNQMNLLGGERIFSRIATKKMFELAKAKEYYKLGKFMIKELQEQEKRPVQYAKN